MNGRKLPYKFIGWGYCVFSGCVEIEKKAKTRDRIMAQRKKVKPKTWTAHVICGPDAKKEMDGIVKKLLAFLNRKPPKNRNTK